MKRLGAGVAISSLLIVSIATGPAQAQTAAGLGDLIGARGSSAESALASRGYQAAGNNGGASLWWRGSSSSCVSMFVDDGRVQSIEGASASQCGKSGGNDAVAAVVGIAAVGLIAALASHKKKQGPDHGGADHDGDYQRGYHDALYGSPYANDDDEAYHSGYMDGQAERQNRASSHSSYVRGGAPQAAKDACTQRGDSYLNMPAGTTVPVNVDARGNGTYEIVVAAGNYRARCSVTAQGNVMGMDPY